jgi:YaiO family outer membrane protein
VTRSLRLPPAALLGLSILCGQAGAAAQTLDASRASATPTSGPPRVSTEARMWLQMETLSNGAADWHDASFEINSDATGPGRWFAAFHQVGRFSLNDELFGGGYIHPLGRKASVTIEGLGSFSHNVVPQFGMGARVDAQAGRGWVLNSGVSGRRYDTGDVTIVSAGLEKYVSRFRLAYTAFGAFLGGEGSVSHAVAFDTTYGSGEDNLFGVTVSTGDELEHDVRAELRVTEVRAISARGRHWIGRRIGLLYTIGVHEQGTDYTRRGGTAGIAFRF